MPLLRLLCIILRIRWHQQLVTKKRQVPFVSPYEHWYVVPGLLGACGSSAARYLGIFTVYSKSLISISGYFSSCVGVSPWH